MASSLWKCLSPSRRFIVVYRLRSCQAKGAEDGAEQEGGNHPHSRGRETIFKCRHWELPRCLLCQRIGGDATPSDPIAGRHR